MAPVTTGTRAVRVSIVYHLQYGQHTDRVQFRGDGERERERKRGGKGRVYVHSTAWRSEFGEPRLSARPLKILFSNVLRSCELDFSRARPSRARFSPHLQRHVRAVEWNSGTGLVEGE